MFCKQFFIRERLNILVVTMLCWLRWVLGAWRDLTLFGRAKGFIMQVSKWRIGNWFSKKRLCFITIWKKNCGHNSVRQTTTWSAVFLNEIYNILYLNTWSAANNLTLIESQEAVTPTCIPNNALQDQQEAEIVQGMWSQALKVSSGPAWFSSRHTDCSWREGCTVKDVRQTHWQQERHKSISCKKAQRA